MKESTEQIYKKRILGVLLYIQQNLDREMSLEELSRRAHFSPYHFHRIFRAVVNEPLKEHIRRLRLERAATHLKHTDRSVIDIALEAGYQTHEAFTRAFRSAMSCSPSAYRSGETVDVPPHSSGIHYHRRATIEDLNLVSGDKTMNVRIEDIGPARVAFVRHIGPYNEVGVAWDKLCMFLGKEGNLGPDSRFIGMCYDDPEVTLPEKIRYDACITVDEDVAGEDDVAIQTIGGGQYAITSHLGSYDQLGRTYAELFRWLMRDNREPRPEPCLEFYLNDPESTEPEDLVTDICVPLKPAT